MRSLHGAVGGGGSIVEKVEPSGNRVRTPGTDYELVYNGRITLLAGIINYKSKAHP